MYEYYKDSNRSAVPLYFIAYNLYHKSLSTDQLITFYDKFDTDNEDYIQCHKWIYNSLLNGVFKSGGAGWIPYKTGVKKILEVIKLEKGQTFPRKKLYEVYKNHPLHFFRLKIEPEFLDYY